MQSENQKHTIEGEMKAYHAMQEDQLPDPAFHKSNYVSVKITSVLIRMQYKISAQIVSNLVGG